MKKIIEKIFSIKNTSDKTHKVLTILGLHLKFKRKINYNVIRRLDNIENLLRVTIQSESLPKAQGQLRVQQIASLALLKNLVQFLSLNNIEYWLEFGTLLGAIRHKGFIPWDDDIDIAVKRDDYEKLKNILPQFCSDGYSFSEGDIIRVYYKETPAQVDIFPFDTGYSEEIPLEDEYNMIIERIRNLYDSMPVNWRNIKQRVSTLPEEYKSKIFELDRREVLMGRPKVEKGFLYLAFHCFAWKRVLCEYEDIFPLRKIEFEGEMFNCPNKIDKHLYEYWGDYMQLPKKCSSHHVHIIEDRYNYENISEMRKLIKNTGIEGKL